MRETKYSRSTPRRGPRAANLLDRFTQSDPNDVSWVKHCTSPASDIETSSGVTSGSTAKTAELSNGFERAPSIRPSIEHLKLAQMLLSCIPSRTRPIIGIEFTAPHFDEDIVAFARRHYDYEQVHALQIRQLQAEADAEWKAELHRSRPPMIYNKISNRDEISPTSRELIAVAAFGKQVELALKAVESEVGEGRMLEELKDIASKTMLGFVLRERHPAQGNSSAISTAR